MTYRTREAWATRELEALVRPLVDYLPDVLTKARRGRSQFSNKHRAMLREIPVAHLAEVVVRGVVGLLWGWKDDDDIEESSDEPSIKIQEVGRTIGLRALRAYVHAKGGPQLSPRLREIEISKLREQISLRHTTEIGFHLTNALNIAV